MSAHAHTPGPWRIDEQASALNQGGFYIEQDVPPSTPRFVITFRGEIEHRAGESAANARLIASAPDLLAACLKALPHHQGGHSEVGRVLRAAIARATGEQP